MLTGAAVIIGPKGNTGADGTVFTPSVSAEGLLSWSNNDGKTNPNPVNIKGPKGDKGDTGATGPQGPKGDPGGGGVTDLPLDAGNGTSSLRIGQISGNSANTALGEYSVAEGTLTVAGGNNAHAAGLGTNASHRSQLVFGEYNAPDDSSSASTNRGNYVEMVGNGTSAHRSNARTLDWNGNEVLGGKLTLGAGPVNNMDAATKQYVDTLISGAIAAGY